jgi:hypothetical protein
VPNAHLTRLAFTATAKMGLRAAYATLLTTQTVNLEISRIINSFN